MINDFNPDSPDDAVFDEYGEELRRWDDPRPVPDLGPQDS